MVHFTGCFVDMFTNLLYFYGIIQAITVARLLSLFVFFWREQIPTWPLRS